MHRADSDHLEFSVTIAVSAQKRCNYWSNCITFNCFHNCIECLALIASADERESIIQVSHSISRASKADEDIYLYTNGVHSVRTRVRATTICNSENYRNVIFEDRWFGPRDRKSCLAKILRVISKQFWEVTLWWISPTSLKQYIICSTNSVFCL